MKNEEEEVRSSPARNAPIEGATVTISGRAMNTNANGGFILMDLRRGAATMRVEKNGYVTHTETVQVGTDTAEKKITLRRD